ncbi:flavodoxin domain-containing protein [Virgibacillus sp. NKC19-16]|uniref:flavodoxin domain-containing protein n=1 Tax=Virgibacillus salidurans TaxID=2831673 RepID=UPI001F298A53|nr:flavodoxin domain-containing protein [Virgibacillus sp. NKC19-16]UJL47745.1 flavodoxin domain-containing protein [Virgibacillus sp. NKC19-16]
MSKILILYTSLTGNTEMMAEAVLKQLEQYDHQVVTKSFEDDVIETRELLDYDAILIGLYTWIDGDLPFEAEDFYDELYDMDLKGKVCGVFGSADTSYEQYGTAVGMVYEQLETLGASMVPDRIIVDLEPNSEELERCKKLVDTACEMVGQKSEM